ncbi:LytR/AlgR family response regulator transcription factor [Sporanaerobium hydrogeniformans]|uniref:LytR/AlgR family response regulator transcription factor n=1 Tax=Sporanaerobium hydrogeniformans TaxID=3072179 RepID=UPI0015D50D24|nr:LytTR family DNA-binding domain-containing protein [Sporanaerobium hydrogeniformans]
MHIAVCDDSIDELSRISLLLEDYRRKRNRPITYEVFQSATELLETLVVRQFDLLLLDILMPGVTGMDAAKELRRWNNEIAIIFLTSSREFAVESYRVSAVDYIIKPVREDELFPTIDKQLIKIAQEEAYLTLKTGNGLIKLPFSKIVYVEVINRIVQFNLIEGEIRETYGYLADYEGALLATSYFYKPHRSYVVNLHQVTELNKNGFFTTVYKIVPVARNSFANAKATYMKYLLSQNERSGKL